MKRISNIVTSSIVIGTVLTISGCEDTDSYYKEEARSLAQENISKEESELAQKLQDLKAVDPTVKDAYYGVDSEGNKELHIIREENGEESSSIWPLVGGMAAGYLMASMIGSGSVNNYSSENRNMYRGGYRCERRLNSDECKRNRHMVVSSYYNYSNTQSNNMVRSPSYKPKYSPNLKSYTTRIASSRTSGALSGSSARSSGSFGG